MDKLKNLSLGTHYAIHLISTLGGCLIGWISTQFSSGDLNIGMALGMVLLIGGIVWHIVFMKCPHCGKHLNPRSGLPNFCPNCGEKME